MVLLLVFMQLTRDLFAIAKFLFYLQIIVYSFSHSFFFTPGKGKGKRRFVLRLVVRISPLRRSGVDHTVLPATYTPHLPLPRSSPEGATTE